MAEKKDKAAGQEPVQPKPQLRVWLCKHPAAQLEFALPLDSTPDDARNAFIDLIGLRSNIQVDVVPLGFQDAD